MARKQREPELTEEEKQAAIALVNAAQQRFVEMLLSGKSITEAAHVLQISRRTATYWMQQDSFVRFAYEHERQKAATEFRERLMKLHDLSLKVLEETLGDGTDPALRVNVAKFVYSTNLAQYASIAPLSAADALIENVLDEDARKKHANLFRDPWAEVLDEL